MVHAQEMATVWVIRGGSGNRLVAAFLREGCIGVEYPALGDGRRIDRSAALNALAPDLPEDAAPPEAEAAMFLSFVRRIQIGDIVAMPDSSARGLVFGVVSGDYEFHADLDPGRARHRRPVEWRRRLPYGELPERLAGIPRQRQLVHDVHDGRLRTLALACCAGELGQDPADRPARASGGTRAPRAPRRPPKATMAERRCMSCFVSKPVELFDGDGDWCRDCE